MRVLLAGATGYLGSVVAERLSNAGHDVVALVRPGRAAPAHGYEQRTGDLSDPDSLATAVTPDIGAVIHAGVPTGDAAVDATAVDALSEPLHGTGRPFVYTSGVWVLGATGHETADEHFPVNPIPIVGYRPGIEQRVLDLAAAGVRSTVIRPGIIHGRGGGIPALLIDLARKHGAPLMIGDATVRWPMVHIEDLGDLFREVVEHAPAGTMWHGVTQSAVPVRELTAAAGAAAGVLTAPTVWPLNEARAELGGAFADALALDQSVSGEAARERFAWRPHGLDAITDLRSGSYR
ncbi:nucleoside-diphosphate-sugar epimerase [Nocardia sp. GAS34]|uniref:NAD-dependent epimerase/dehydratase family protein n=1 Tax=unclassified Nocardia TaxID=2637762 RepID=UPI003D1A28E1